MGCAGAQLRHETGHRSSSNPENVWHRPEKRGTRDAENTAGSRRGFLSGAVR